MKTIRAKIPNYLAKLAAEAAEKENRRDFALTRSSKTNTLHDVKMGLRSSLDTLSKRERSRRMSLVRGKKLLGNVIRDRKNITQLKIAGWSTLIMRPKSADVESSNFVPPFRAPGNTAFPT